MVRLPLGARPRPDGQGPRLPPTVRPPGTPRPAGVHLHWAMPDALLRGTLGRAATGREPAGPAALPDRWVVLRLLTPDGATTVAVRGWVLEADRARGRPGRLAGRAARPPPRRPARCRPAELTGTAGGSPTWAATYDAVLNRFAFHDPLDDLATGARTASTATPRATSSRAGGRTRASTRSTRAQPRDSLDALLHALGLERGDARWGDTPATSAPRTTCASRAGRGQPDAAQPVRRSTRTTAAPPGAAAAADQPISAQVTDQVRSDAGADEAAAAFAATPRWPHATLLHGSVYGVPLRGARSRVAVDDRPSADGLRVALGSTTTT